MMTSWSVFCQKLGCVWSFLGQKVVFHGGQHPLKPWKPWKSPEMDWTSEKKPDYPWNHKVPLKISEKSLQISFFRPKSLGWSYRLTLVCLFVCLVFLAKTDHRIFLNLKSLRAIVGTDKARFFDILIHHEILLIFGLKVGLMVLDVTYPS